MNKKRCKRLLSILLAVAVLAGILAVPASAATLYDSNIQQAGFGNYLSKVRAAPSAAATGNTPATTA